MKGERKRLLPRGPHSVQAPGGVDGRAKWKIRMACACILVAETLERVTFYSIVGNLVLFLNKMPYEWESYNAANASFYLFGVSYIMSLFAGWLADSCLGRWRTILLSLVIYIGGCVFLPFLSYAKTDDSSRSNNSLPRICHIGHSGSYNVDTSIPPIYDNVTQSSLNDVPPAELEASFIQPFKEKCAWAIYLSLLIIGIGAGSLKANIAPFGADQLKNAGPKAMRVFFNWFYWCVNLGAFIALGGIAYIQQQYQFFLGYLIACGCLSAAAIVFIIGCGSYVTRPASGSILTNVFKVIVDSCRSSRVPIDSENEWLLPNIPRPKPRKVKFLDKAKVQYGGRFTDGIVEDVRSLLKIILVFLCLIPYWMVYFQMETTFYIQGLHMRLSFSGDGHHPQVAVAWLSLFDVAFLILLIPFMDRLVYPRLDKAGYHFSLGMRMALGMLFATFAVAVAGGVETRRLQIFWPNQTDPFKNASFVQMIGGTSYQAANMSVFWQIPQYALIGISEVFTSIAALEFAYSKAPKSMKGIIMGTFFFFSGAGSLLGTSLMYAFNGVWFFGFDNGNINCRFPSSSYKTIGAACHLDYYFYFLAGLEVAGLIVFIIVIRCLNFHRDDVKPQVANRRQLGNLEESEDFFVGQARPRRTGLLYGDT